jgi:hypothetical protein
MPCRSQRHVSVRCSRSRSLASLSQAHTSLPSLFIPQMCVCAHFLCAASGGGTWAALFRTLIAVGRKTPRTSAEFRAAVESAQFALSERRSFALIISRPSYKFDPNWVPAGSLMLDSVLFDTSMRWLKLDLNGPIMTWLGHFETKLKLSPFALAFK